MSRKFLLAALVVGLPMTLGGCPMGDCWSTVDAAITVDDSITIVSSKPLQVVMVPKINDSDVVGTNGQGIPEGDREHHATLTLTTDEATRTYQGRSESEAPYETWIYAYIDANDSGTLDSQDPFGVDANNPTDLGTKNGCKDYASTITIDRLYP